MLPQRFWHNSTGVADLPSMAEAVDQLWPGQTTSALDGVLYMDPDTLAALLDLTGPIELPDLDEALTADTAADFLLRDQYVEFPNDDRHDFLVDAATTVFDELTSGSLPAPAVIAETLAPAVGERRLLLHSFHRDEQALFERLELDGALPPVDGDFLSVHASNRGLNKLDAMLQRTIDYEVAVDPRNGAVRSTLTVTLENRRARRRAPLRRHREPAGGAGRDQLHHGRRLHARSRWSTPPRMASRSLAAPCAPTTATGTARWSTCPPVAVSRSCSSSRGRWTCRTATTSTSCPSRW